MSDDVTTGDAIAEAAAPPEKPKRGRPRKHNLPPAGDAQRDELKRREDQLHARAEKEIPQGGAIRSDVLKEDREVLSEIYDFNGYNQLQVKGALPDYVYKWVKIATANSPTDMVAQEQVFAVIDADGNRVPCWEVVCGSMPEASDCKDATGVRRIVDVILMRCRKDRYEALMRYQAEQHARQVAGVNATALEMGERLRGRGITVSEIGTTPQDWVKTRQEGMRHLAMQGLGNQIREGTVPGLPVPGR